MMMSNLHLDDVHQLRTALGKHATDFTDELVTTVAKSELSLRSDVAKLAAVDEVLLHIQGLGPLSDLITKPGVTDVLINGHDEVWFDRGDGLERADISWPSEQDLREFAVRLVNQMHRRLDETQPFADVRLKNGVRMHAIIPPLTQSGTCISLRLPQQDALSLDQLVAKSMLSVSASEILTDIIHAGVSFLICGGTGTGKTTLLGALLMQISKQQRIVVVEDLFELTVHHPHVLNLQARQSNVDGVGTVSMRHLVRQALRMRPDRLIVGEVRGVEVIDFFTAMNTGHKGGCATIHANSARDVPARVETLGLLAGLPLSAIHNLFQCAISVILEVKHVRNLGRRLVSLHLVELVDGRAQTIPVFDWGAEKTSASGLRKFENLLNSTA